MQLHLVISKWKSSRRSFSFWEGQRQWSQKLVALNSSTYMQVDKGSVLTACVLFRLVSWRCGPVHLHLLWTIHTYVSLRHTQSRCYLSMLRHLFVLSLLSHATDSKLASLLPPLDHDPKYAYSTVASSTTSCTSCKLKKTVVNYNVKLKLTFYQQRKCKFKF